MTIFYYVDTASTSGGGDGSTRTHGGSGGTAACQEMVDVEAQIDGDYVSIAAAGDHITVKFAGSTVDATAVFWNALGSDATYTLTLMGDDGANDSGGDDGSGYDDDGRYTGPLDWSTSHYRMSQSASSSTLRLYKPVTVNGIQVEGTHATNGNALRVINDVASPAASFIVENCRIACSDSSSFSSGWYLEAATLGCTAIVRNCIITNVLAGGYAIWFRPKAGEDTDCQIYNCTIYGNDAAGAYGIRLLESAGSTGNVDIRNCAVGKFASGLDYSASISGSTTVTGGYNGSDDNDIAGGPNTGDVTLGTHTDEWVDPTGTAPGDYNFSPLTDGGLFGAASLSYTPSLDVDGKTRNPTTPDVGAVEAGCWGTWAASWGNAWGCSWRRNSVAHPVNPFGHPLRGPFAGPIS